jgi:hypothetical protein
MKIQKKYELAKWYQEFPYFHPLTCGVDSRHTELEPILTDDRITWKCNDCGYHQNNDPLEKMYGYIEEATVQYDRLIKNSNQ